MRSTSGKSTWSSPATDAPAGVVLSSEEYEALAETLEVLEDEETLAALRESEADVREGRVYPIDEVRRELGLG